MNFGLDWDGTVNQAYALWAIWTREAIRAGHRVYVVTMRYPSEVDDYMRRWCFNNGVHSIVTTSRGPKRPAVEQLGLRIDVWIDDNPRAVEEGAAILWGAATPEGEVVEENRGEAGTVTAEFPAHPVPDPFMDLADRRMGDLDAEQKDRASEKWMRDQLPDDRKHRHVTIWALIRIIDRLREGNARLTRELEQERADTDKLMDAFHLRPQMFRTDGGRLRVKDLARALRLMMRPNG